MRSPRLHVTSENPRQIVKRRPQRKKYCSVTVSKQNPSNLPLFTFLLLYWVFVSTSFSHRQLHCVHAEQKRWKEISRNIIYLQDRTRDYPDIVSGRFPHHMGTLQLEHKEIRSWLRRIVLPSTPSSLQTASKASSSSAPLLNQLRRINMLQ